MSNLLMFNSSTNELIIVDNLCRLKTMLVLDSPFWLARKVFWDQWTVLFWNDTPVHVPWNDTQRFLQTLLYWKTPPTLELPERAQSLSDWSHCCWCGFPLDVAFVDCVEIQERGFVRNEL